jgi:hypothetical protein
LVLLLAEGTAEANELLMKGSGREPEDCAGLDDELLAVVLDFGGV